MVIAYPIMGEILLFLLASIALYYTYNFGTRHTTASRVVLIHFVSNICKTDFCYSLSHYPKTNYGSRLFLLTTPYRFPTIVLSFEHVAKLPKLGLLPRVQRATLLLAPTYITRFAAKLGKAEPS